MFASGPLTGTLAPSAGRTVIGGKSPLTGILSESNMGGYFSYQLKSAGFDHIIVRGAVSEPVYLFIDNGEIQLETPLAYGERESSRLRRLRKKPGEHIDPLHRASRGKPSSPSLCHIGYFKMSPRSGKNWNGSPDGIKDVESDCGPWRQKD